MRPPRIRLSSQNSLPEIFPTKMNIFNMLGHGKDCGSANSRTSSASVVSDASQNPSARKPHLACPALPGIPVQAWLRDAYAPPGISKQAGHTLSLCGSLSEQVAKLHAGDLSRHNHRPSTTSSERYNSPSLFADSLVGIGAFFGSSGRVPTPSSAEYGTLLGSTRLPALSPAFSDTLPLPPASGLPSLSAVGTVAFSNRGGGAGIGKAGQLCDGGGADVGGSQSRANKTRRSSKVTSTKSNRPRHQPNRNNGNPASPLVKGGNLMQFQINTRLACLLYKVDPEAYWRCAQEHFASAAATLDHLPLIHGSEITEKVLTALLRMDKVLYRGKLDADSATSDKEIWQTALCIIVPLMLPMREKLQPYVGQPLLEETDYRSVLVQFCRQAHQGILRTEPADASLTASYAIVNGGNVHGPVQPDSLLIHPNGLEERPPAVLLLPSNTPQKLTHMQHPSPVQGFSPPGLTISSDTASLSSGISMRMAHEMTQPAPPQYAELDAALPNLENSDVDHNSCPKVQGKLHTPASSSGIVYIDPRILQKDRQQRTGRMAATTEESADIPWEEFLNQ